MPDDPIPDEESKDDLAEDAKRLIGAFGDEVDKRVNKILDERMRVDKNDDNKEDVNKEDDGIEDDDDPPKPKSFAEKLGF